MTRLDLTPMTVVKSKRKAKQGIRQKATKHNPSTCSGERHPCFLSLHGALQDRITLACGFQYYYKYDRCKDTIDVSNIKDTGKRDGAGTRSETCKKCANSLGTSNGLRPMWVIHC